VRAGRRAGALEEAMDPISSVPEAISPMAQAISMSSPTASSPMAAAAVSPSSDLTTPGL